MPRIFVARHGQNEDNANGILNGHRDEPLTSKGIEQAEEVAAKIAQAGLSFDAVYCSPLVRAEHTAKIISSITNNPEPIIEPLLVERDFGVMTGVEQSKIEELCAPEIIKTETITYFLNPEGAETFPDLIERADELLDKIDSTHKDSDILLVTHGDIGKMIYAAYYKLPWKEVLMMFHFGNSEVLLLSEDTEPGEAHLFQILQHNH